MSSVATTNCCGVLCNKCAENFPRIAKSSGCIAKWALITGIISLILASIFCGTMLAVNPQLTFPLGYSVNQLIYVGVSFGTGVLSLITASCFYALSGRVKKDDK